MSKKCTITVMAALCACLLMTPLFAADDAINPEESASASQELNTQAGQMTQAVQELIALVGASTTKAVPSARRQQPVRQRPGLGVSDHLLHDISRAPQHNESSGETVRALPNDGFSEFNN